MNYTYISEKDADSRGLLAKGNGKFKILKAEEKYSKSSHKPMVYFMLEQTDCNGKKGIIHDNILLTEDFAWKFRHASYSVGLSYQYENKTISADMFIGKIGFNKIGIKENKESDKAPQNIVFDYINPKNSHIEIQNNEEKLSNDSSMDDDDIPF